MPPIRVGSRPTQPRSNPQMAKIREARPVRRPVEGNKGAAEVGEAAWVRPRVSRVPVKRVVPSVEAFPAVGQPLREVRLLAQAPAVPEAEGVRAAEGESVGAADPRSDFGG